MKFGGTSMGSPERINDVATIVSGKSENAIVVVSAMAGTTNKLIDIARLLQQQQHDEAQQCIASLRQTYCDVNSALLHSADARTRMQERIEKLFHLLTDLCSEEFVGDYEARQIVAIGEQLSTKLLTERLAEMGHSVSEWNALDFMRTDNMGAPDTDYLHQVLSERIERDDLPQVVVTQGFICMNAYGEVDNLQRGGSDYTATLVSAAVNASACEIWTDVSGVHTADPRHVTGTHTIDHLHYDEAIALAYYGAKVLHPVCVAPCKQHHVPIRLLNTMAPNDEGTRIDDRHDNRQMKAATTKDDIRLLTLRWHNNRCETARREAWQQITQHVGQCLLLHATHTQLMLCLAQGGQADSLVAELEKAGQVHLDDTRSLLTIVGDDMGKHTTAVTSAVLKALEGYTIDCICAGTTDNTLCLLTDRQQTHHILQQLNDTLLQ